MVVVETPEKIEEGYTTRKPEDLPTQRTLKPEDIFTKSQKRILMVGSAGVGKSSFVQQLALDWSKMNKWHEKFIFVFHFRCRDLMEQCPGDLTMTELLTNIHSPDMAAVCNREQFFRTIMDNKSKILIIIDGLDELVTWNKMAKDNTFISATFPVDMKTNIANLINGLMNGNVLSGVAVLVTTRPKETLSMLTGLRSILILGFNQENVQKCIQYVCEGHVEYNDKYYTRIVDYLHSNSTIMNLCVVPFMCTLFAVVALESLRQQGQIKVTNMTQLVILAIRHLVKRRNNDKSQWKFNTVQSERLKSLSALAKECTISNKILFNVAEMHNIELGQNEVELGLLECFKAHTIGTEPETYYSFIHLMIQEFLTAVHLCLNEEDVTLFSKVDHSRMDDVQLFMAGLLADNTSERAFLKDLGHSVPHETNIKNLLTMISNQDVDSEMKRLHLIRCAHEGKKLDICESVKATVNSEETKCLNLSSIPGLLPHHLASVGWFVQETQCVRALK